MADVRHKDIANEELHDPKAFVGSNSSTYNSKDENGNSRYEKMNILPDAINFVDGSLAPPTGLINDTYVLINEGGGSIHANWGADAAYNDWVRNNGETWVVNTPIVGTICFDSDADTYKSFDGLEWAEFIQTGILNVDTAGKALLSPIDGDFVYDTDLNSLQRFDDFLGDWVDIAKGYGGAVRYTDNIPYFYENPKLAYNSATDGDLITLLGNYEDTSGDQTIIKKNVVLDLNGFTWTWNNSGTSNMFSLTGGATTNDLITIKNGNIVKTGGGAGDAIYSTISVNWALNNLSVKSDSRCFIMKGGVIDAYGSFFESDYINNGCNFSTGTQRLFGGNYKNIHPTGTNSSAALYMTNTTWEAIGGTGCTVSGSVADSVFISVSGAGLSQAGSSPRVTNCFAYSDSGTAADLNSGVCSNIYAESQSGTGIDGAGCKALYHCVGITKGASLGLVTADLNVHCYAESNSNHAFFAAGDGDKIHNGVGIVLSGNGYGVFCNSNNIQIINTHLEIANSGLYGISGGAISKYVTGVTVKGTSTGVADFTGIGVNLWAGIEDPQGNSFTL